MSSFPQISVSRWKIGVLFVFLLSWSLSWAKGPQPTSCLLRNLTLLQNLETGHLATRPEKYAAIIAKKNEELAGLAYDGLIPWHPRKRDAVKRFFIEKFGMNELGQELPAFDKTQQLGKADVDIMDIHWSQVNARNMSQDGKYSVVGNAKSFKEGKLKVSDLPPIRVWRDATGKIWTLDHRRLAAMRLSGVIEQVPVEFVDEATVKAQQFKFGTLNGGKSLFVWMDEPGTEAELSIVISNDIKNPIVVEKNAHVEFYKDASVSTTKSKPVTQTSEVIKPNAKTGHLGEADQHQLLLKQTEKDISHLNHQGVIPWGPKSRDAVKRFFIEKFNMNFMVQKMPTFDKAQKLGKAEVSVNDIRFSQIRCRNSSQDGKYSVLGNAKSIQEGKLKVTDLPTIRVWRDTEGRIWTLDHRRLAAIRLSGMIDKITVEFVDEALVKAQKFKFDTLNEGKSMFVWLDDAKKETDLSVVIAPNNMTRSTAGSQLKKVGP
jgi:hypothetical protein